MIILIVIIAAVLGGLAIYTMRYTAQLDETYGPIGGFVEVDGARLHYIERLPDPAEITPQGPPIVLLHGASANARDMMISLMNPLAIRGHRVIAVDRPGHGYSERGPDDAYKPSVQARMIRDAAARLGVEKPIVVGHSWSGAVTAAYLLDHGADMAGAVILSGATHPWGGGTSWYNTVAVMPVIGPILRHCFIALAGPQLLPGGIERNFAPNAPVTDYADRAGIALLFRPHEFLANARDSVHLHDELERQSERYGEIDTPLTILTGDKDRTVGYKIHSVPLHEQVQGSELIILPGVGHMPHHVDTAAVVQAIADLARAVR